MLTQRQLWWNERQKIIDMSTPNDVYNNPLFGYYGDDGYFIINNCLRYNILTPRFTNIVNSMVTTINTLSLSQQKMTVYRGIRYKQEFVAGNTFMDMGFLSTSYDKKVASGISRNLLQIVLPVGIPFAFLSSEFEILLPPKTKFTVDSVNYDEGDDSVYVTMTFVGIDNSVYYANQQEIPDSSHLDDISYLQLIDKVYNLRQYDYDV
jgi:hypothetical protein